MSCWLKLSTAEREACFDAGSKPKHRLTLKNIWRVNAWAVKGPLQQEWNSLLPQIVEISRGFREQLFGKAHRHASGALPTIPKWSLYLVGRKARANALTPMIIAEHGNINIAKRASRAFEDLKDGSLGQLLQGYSFHYAEYAIKLCSNTDDTGLLSSEPSKINLCGLHVVISSPGECISVSGTIWTHSTIGGCIRINGNNYGLTAAHAFPDIANGEPSPSSEQRTSSGLLRSRKVYVQTGTIRDLSNDELVIQAQTPDTNMLLNDSSTDLEDNDTSSILYNCSQDWALIPIMNGNFALHNQVDLGKGQILSIGGLAETLPTEPVFVASGVTEPSVSEVSNTSSAMLLPGSDRLQIVCTASRQSNPGDCGSWIIDKEGRPCAMVVAASEQAAGLEAETYCLPLLPIFSDIQEDLKAQLAVPSLRDTGADALSKYDFRSHSSYGGTDENQVNAERLSDVNLQSSNSDSDADDAQVVNDLDRESSPERGGKRDRRTFRQNELATSLPKANGDTEVTNIPLQTRRSSQNTNSTISIMVEERRDRSRTSNSQEEPDKLVVQQLALSDGVEMSMSQSPSEGSKQENIASNLASQIRPHTREGTRPTQGTANSTEQSTSHIVSRARETEESQEELDDVEDFNRDGYGSYSDGQLVLRNPNISNFNLHGSQSTPQNSKEKSVMRPREGSRNLKRGRSDNATTGNELVIRHDVLEGETPTNQTDSASRKRDQLHASTSSNHYQIVGSKSFIENQSDQMKTKPRTSAKGKSLEFKPYNNPENGRHGNLYGSDEERQRKSDRRARRPISRTFSRRYIDPETLKAYGIRWKWESDDDWNVVVNEDLTEMLEMELRAHTKGLHLLREHRAQDNGAYADENLPWKPRMSKRQSFERLRDDKNSKEDTNFDKKLRKRISGGNFSENDKERILYELTEPKDPDMARYNDKRAEEMECHLFDLQFESDVQNLLWEAGCSIEFCDNIIKGHSEKERRKAMFARSLVDGDNAGEQGQRHAETVAKVDPLARSRPMHDQSDEFSMEPELLTFGNKLPATVKPTRSDRRADQERTTRRRRELELA